MSLVAGWLDEAACRDVDPEVFFADVYHPRDMAYAKRVCFTCRVLEHCRDRIDRLEAGQSYQTYKLNGIWAGERPDERRKRRAKLRNPERALTEDDHQAYGSGHWIGGGE